MNVTEAVKNIAAAAEKTIPIIPTDYQVDGLWYCSTCRTPKEYRLETPEGETVVRCLCECALEKRKAQESADLARHQEQLRHEWLAGFERMTFANDNGSNPTMSFARRFVAHWPEILETGASFTLTGGVGCGKTYAAAAIANEILSKGYRVWMVTMPDLVDRMGMDELPRTLQRLKNFELVVLDDFGAERETSYAAQKAFDAIDCRCKAGLPTIVTTNLDITKKPEDLAYSRTFSRLRGFAPPFKCKGNDLRQGAGLAKRKALTELLTEDEPCP